MSVEPESQFRRDSIERLAEDFVGRIRSGDRPLVDEYVAQHPNLASQIREFFPLLNMIEEMHEDGKTVSDQSSHETGSDLPLPRIGGYQILGELGRGGMGIVYEALQTELGRRVALKVVPGDLSVTTDQTFLREEARKLATVQHPNIVQIYDVGEYEGRPYFSMQLVEGQSLSNRLASGPLMPREAASLLLEVCQAIAEAHRCGIVHRDLKPSNILLDNTGRPLVADFGLAQFVELGTLTATGLVAGTPSYMSPEQATSGNPGPSSDIYSLGAVLYEMLTGRPPFQSASPVETIMMVLEEDPLLPRTLNSRVDRDLEAIAMRCLQKQPELRYSDVDALASDIRAYVEDEPISVAKNNFTNLFEFFRRETRFGPVMEVWGSYLMFSGWYLLSVYGICAALKFAGVNVHLYYYAVWAASYPPWYLGYKWIRRWKIPTSLVERQLGHLWTGGAAICVLTLVLEGTLRLPALILCPVYGVVQFAQSYAMANLLSRMFYLPALAYFMCAIMMLIMVRVGELQGNENMYAAATAIFAILSWIAFFIPGLIYHRRLLARRRRNNANRVAKP